MLGRILAAAALGLVACGPLGPDRRAHPDADVLLLTVDTLRADHVGLLGYGRPTTPSIDGFFAGGRIYERAYSTSASTSPSVVSLLTGLLPHQHRVRLLFQLVPGHLETLAELLPKSHQRAAFVSNMVLTDEAIGLAQLFDVYDDFVAERESARLVFERTARRTTNAALRWLAESRDPARPLFLWVHYIDPHGPYRPPPHAAARFTHDGVVPLLEERVLPFQLEPGVSDAGHYVDRYDEEIAHVDAEIGRLLAGYARRFDLDRALVIFTADHGESMTEREVWFSHGFNVYEEIVRVPLFVRGPDVVAGRSPLPVSGIDVAPTILRFLGVEPPAAMSKVDLRDGSGLDPGRAIVVEATERGWQWRALIQGQRKWVVLLRGGRSVHSRRFYALDEDPGERRIQTFDVSQSGGAALLELVATDPDPAGVSSELAPGTEISVPKLARDVSPETRRRLEALGYAEPQPDDPAAP